MKHNYFEVNKIEGGPFDYVLSTGPIDYFYLTLTKSEFEKKLKAEIADYPGQNNFECILNGCKSIDELEGYIIGYVNAIEEKPNTIRYFGIPNQGGCDFDLAVIAKISNNGTCFIFSNNSEFLEIINN